MTKRGFSLIELLIVISIVGILAAIAVPAYSAYMVRTKLVSLIRVIETLQPMTYVYAEKNGRFPNAYELKLAALPGELSVDDPSAFVPAGYMQGPNAGITSVDMNQITCVGKLGSISVVVDAQALGIPGSTSDGFVFLSSQTLYENGTFEPLNFYYIVVDGTNYLGGDYIPGWYNYVLDSAGTLNQTFVDLLDAQAAAANDC